MVADVPRLDTGCQVWWADPAEARPEHLTLLDRHEAGRRARLRQRDDRDRLVVGVALARLVLGRHLGCAPPAVRLDRTCPDCAEPHGKPRVLAAGGLELTVSHSGARVAVAVARRHPIGLDVEQLDPRVDVDGLAEQVLSHEEAHQAARVPEPRDWLLRYWTRKESVLKATGDGLRVPLPHLTVTAPREPPALRHWRGRPHMPERVRLVDLQWAGYASSLAVLDAPRLDVAGFDGSDLLHSWVSAVDR
jgi:4'-phosphopantetheinyl transferase